MKHTYNMHGMTCNNCVLKVENAIKKIGMVQFVKVTLQPLRAEITMSGNITFAQFNAFLSLVGEYRLSEIHNDGPQQSSSVYESYRTLIFIFGVIIILVALAQLKQGSFNFIIAMNHFIALFLLIFSIFKLINLKEFAFVYSSYDIISARLPGYGYIYPFIELMLGMAYLFHSFPLITNTATLLIMLVSGIGAIRSLKHKSKIPSTHFKLPLSLVTLTENLLMAAMSGTMLAIYLK